jgi:hypothetical protein
MVNDDSAAELDRDLASLDGPTAAPHPEEMKGTVNLSIGNWVSVTATGRATPAGFIAAALFACAVLVPLLRVTRRK